LNAPPDATLENLFAALFDFSLFSVIGGFQARYSHRARLGFGLDSGRDGGNWEGRRGWRPGYF